MTKRFVLGIIAAVFAASLSYAAPTAKWWENAVFYQIFPMSYYDTDGDGMGDLNGITAKLDYIKSLGVTAIWLTPIHPHPLGLYHGYAVSDYYAVNPELGTMADFEKLISEAHSRGIKIVMDLVMNHTSVSNKWFVESARNNPTYANWYIWKASDPGGWPNASGNNQMPSWHKLVMPGAARDGQVYYAAFNFSLPDLNHALPAVRDEFRKIAKFWITKGVDGFRIDAARYLIEDGPGKQLDTPETIKYLNDFAAYVKTVNPNTYVVAEVYAGVDVTKNYYQAGGVDSVFCFDIGGKGGTIQGSFQTGKNSSFYAALDKLLNSGVTPQYFSHFFSNHDSGRLPENLRDADKIKAAAVAMFTIPGGAPYIYYGDEIGEREGFNLIGDAAKRNPMWWDGTANAGFTTRSAAWVKKMKVEFYTNVNVALQANDPQSTLSLFKKLIALRESQPTLIRGVYSYINMDLSHMVMTDEPDSEITKNPLISFVRVAGNQVAIVLVNPGKHPVEIKQDVASAFVQENKGFLKPVASLYSQDLTKPLPDSIANDILRGTFDLVMQPRDFIVLIAEIR